MNSKFWTCNSNLPLDGRSFLNSTPYLCRFLTTLRTSYSTSKKSAGSIRKSSIVFFISLLLGTSLVGQTYLKNLEDSGDYSNQRLARFRNGDILIANSSLKAQRTGRGGQLFATRIDKCGIIKWSKSYNRQQEYLELKDMAINDAGEIFLYGSAYIGLDELIFLLKLSENGEILQFRLVQQETVDNFTYSIDVKNNQLLAYGLLLGFDTRKLGFVAVFDENLNFRWAKKFEPFESTGDAIITAEGAFICRSGQFLMKLDKNGELEWATNLLSVSGAKPIAGPLEVSGGYIFQAQKDNFAFLYKIDKIGNLLWQSDKFPTTNSAAAILLLSDGNLSVLYNCPDNESTYPCQLLLSPNGEVLKQQQLASEFSFQTGTLYQSIHENIVTIAGSTDPFSAGAGDIQSFLLQYDTTVEPDDCFYWKDFQHTIPNDIVLTFVPIDTSTTDARMTILEAGKIIPQSFDAPYRDRCEPSSPVRLIPTDTLLDCGASWQVSLPSSDFRWEDNVRTNPRTLHTPGTYRATNRSCANSITYEYTLQLTPCNCQVYLPTGFSPNDDGENDYLQLFSNCTMQEVHMTVYSRWGERVFESHSPTNFWNGKHNYQLLPEGVYVVRIYYRWLDENGAMQEGSLVQDVTLLR